MEQIPVPNASDADRDAIGKLTEHYSSLGEERYELQSAVRRRIAHTFGADGASLNTKAQSWWELSLNELGAALKASFKLAGNPFKNPRVADDWERYLGENLAEVARLTTQLTDAEAELNDRVFYLFKLKPEEIRLLQKEVEH